MIFKEIQFENFFSYGPHTTKIDLSKKGLFLITGANGTGKSSILDSISFALFGKVTKDVKLPNIVNEQTGKNCKVKLAFEALGNDYTIVRYRQHEKMHDSVKLYKGFESKENLISKSNKSDTQELINNLLNINYKSFINAVMLSGESVDSFLEADPWKKKEIIENILQIEVMTKYHWIAQQKRKLAKKEVTELELESEGLNKLLDSVKKSMTDYAISCKNKKTENSKNIEELEIQLKDIDNINIELEFKNIREAETLAQTIEQKMTEYQQIADKVISFENEKDTLNDSLLEYKGFIKTNNKNKSKSEKIIKDLETKTEEISEEIETAKENPEKCPVCTNNINEEELKHWITDKEEKKETYNENIISEQANLKKTIEQTTLFLTKAKNLTELIEDIDNKIKKSNKEAKTLKKEYEEIEIPKTKNEEELKALEQEKLKIETSIIDLKNKKFIDEEYLHTLKQQGLDASKSIKEKKKALEKAKQEFVITEWWENSLSSKKNSMKSWCINNIIGYFNTRIKFYMDRFFDGEVSITMDTELNESITRLGKARSFGMFSRGEKRRLNLAILFALFSLVKANISSKINIMFLDEILSNHLDDQGISTVLELLEEMKDNNETVFIIEHREHFKDYPSFIPISVYKDKHEFSHIKV